MPLDLPSLWDFRDPAASEDRFRAALAAASADDALILHTQIARSYGLRRDFARAREILAAIETQIAHAGPEAQARYHLELGRSYASATHPPETQTDEARQVAGDAFQRAAALAQAAGLDDLAIDALHMLAFIEAEPDQQLRWNLAALACLEASSQAEARRWEASLRNNIGYTLHTLGRYAEALAQFELALAARERVGGDVGIRIAWWMIAWTYRAMGRHTEALDVQLRLEREWAAAGDSDPYVFEELAHLYRALGDAEGAARYAALLAAARPG